MSCCRYTIRLGSTLFDTDQGGVYVVKLSCSDGAATTSVRKGNPGGITVDPASGRITGTPVNVGEGYRMRLIAEDSGGSELVIAAWNFSVVSVTIIPLMHPVFK